VTEEDEEFRAPTSRAIRLYSLKGDLNYKGPNLLIVKGNNININLLVEFVIII
jgi:hypothetical protein